MEEEGGFCSEALSLAVSFRGSEVLALGNVSLWGSEVLTLAVSLGGSEDLSMTNFSKRSSFAVFSDSISLHIKPHNIVANLLDCFPQF